MNSRLILISFFCFLLLNCAKDSESICNPNHSQLKDGFDFPCGVVADLNLINTNPRYDGLLRSQFNSLTAENLMKPENLHPSQGLFYWADADSLVNYARMHKHRMHGHTLIWHEQLPLWIMNYEGSKHDWENLLRNHVKSIVSHFKGRVSSWDVVNEAFNDDGTLRNSIWKQKIGSSYIEKAFQYAHESDPAALLFYNDYALAVNPVKRRAVLKYFNSLKTKGVKVHGIGLQMHIFTAFPENLTISTAIDEVWQSDYLVHLSELDISMNPLSSEMPAATSKELERQADKFAYIFNAYTKIPRRYQYGITIWGVSDANSWIRSYYNRDDYPLLFDNNYQPKPAYCKLINQ